MTSQPQFAQLCIKNGTYKLLTDARKNEGFDLAYGQWLQLAEAAEGPAIFNVCALSFDHLLVYHHTLYRVSMLIMRARSRKQPTVTTMRKVPHSFTCTALVGAAFLFCA